MKFGKITSNSFRFVTPGCMIRSRVVLVAVALLLLAAYAVRAHAQTVSVVHSFNGSDGQWPGSAGLTQGRDGRLYGTTYAGGTYGLGTVFKQRTEGTANLTLHSFSGLDGANPVGGLSLARDGSYYGTTSSGGAFNHGEVFKITPGGVLTVLYSFTGGADGTGPSAAPIQATDGNFYGTTLGDLSTIYATVYRITSGGALSTIYTFPSLLAQPHAAILQASSGDLYVPTYQGGTFDVGSIVKMTTAGVVKATHSFSQTTGGYGPLGALIQAADGSIYGTTFQGGLHQGGTIFSLNSQTGQMIFMYNFGASTTDGLFPTAGLAQGTDGNFYGSTVFGGDNGAGSLFSLTSAGAYSQLYSFPENTGSSSQQPVPPPVQDTRGVFYGTTQFGGSNSLGSVYTLDMRLGPFVAFVRPSGKVASTAQILGQGLTGTTSVTFNGVPATSFSVVSDTYMTAVVPSGATTGAVVVTTPSGTLTSNISFRITQ